MFRRDFIPAHVRDCPNARQTMTTPSCRIRTMSGRANASHCIMNQGTVWPWLLGAFVDAWVSIHKHTPAALHQTRREFLQPLLEHLENAGLGHISEIADAEAPHTPCGCPWQAWLVGEALWLDQVVLTERAQPVSEMRRRTSAAVRTIVPKASIASKPKSVVQPRSTRPFVVAAAGMSSGNGDRRDMLQRITR